VQVLSALIVYGCVLSWDDESRIYGCCQPFAYFSILDASPRQKKRFSIISVIYLMVSFMDSSFDAEPSTNVSFDTLAPYILRTLGDVLYCDHFAELGTTVGFLPQLRCSPPSEFIANKTTTSMVGISHINE
ncbi:hypothetical protein EDC04DRAFT_2829818, partial [Pisolithus marmoratus]